MGRRIERVLVEIPSSDAAPLWKWKVSATAALEESLKYRGMKRVGAIDTRIHHRRNAWIEATCLAEKDVNAPRIDRALKFIGVARGA